jgi:hypothetical protein
MNEKFLKMLNNDVSLYPSKLEVEYPHIFTKLVELWDTSQLKQYLDEVVFDARGDRSGFHDDIGNELWKLHLHRLKTDSLDNKTASRDYWDWIN